MEKHYHPLNVRIATFLVAIVSLFATSLHVSATSPSPFFLKNGAQLPNSYKWEAIPESSIINLKGADSKNSMLQKFIATDLQANDKSAARAIRRADDQALSKLYITVDTLNFKYLGASRSLTCHVMSKSANIHTYAKAEAENWYFDAPLVAVDLPVADDYTVFIQLDTNVDDYKEDVVCEASILNFVNDIKVSDESSEVTVKLTDAKNTYEYVPLDPDGKPYPTLYTSEGADYSSSSFPVICICGVPLGVWNLGNVPYLYMSPDTDDTAYFQGNATLQYEQVPNIYTTNSLRVGPFTESFTLSNNPEDYEEYSAKFLLTELDKQCPAKGVGYVNWQLGVDDRGPFTSKVYSNTGVAGSPFTEANIYVCEFIDYEAGVVESAWSPETRTVWDMDSWMGEMKVSGSFMNDADGNRVIVGHNICGNGNGGYTFLSPVKEFNIYPDQTPVNNFYNTLFASSELEIQTWDNEHAGWAELKVEAKGPYNEYVSIDDPWLFVDSFTCNGEEIEDHYNVSAYELANSQFEVALTYDNVLVEGTFTCSAEAKISVNTATGDFFSPKMTNLQVRDEDGNIVTRIPKDKKGQLLLAATDNTGKLATLEISVAPEGSKDFKPLTADIVADENLGGSYAVADLSGLENDTFYSIKVVMKDEAGNSCENTVHYVFNITDEESGVKSIEINGNAANAQYFNLQGLRVSEPQNGEIYIVKRGDKVSKEIYRK